MGPSLLLNIEVLSEEAPLGSLTSEIGVLLEKEKVCFIVSLPTTFGLIEKG